jgi:hypothetical protein
MGDAAAGGSDSGGGARDEVAQPAQQKVLSASSTTNRGEQGPTVSEILQQQPEDRVAISFDDDNQIHPVDVDAYAEQIYRANRRIELSGPISLDVATLLEYNRSADLRGRRRGRP